MIAVHFERRRASIREVGKPRRPARYATIRFLCGGICNTDLELLSGYYGFSGTPGHEFVGEVVAADDSTLIGRRVVGEINLACQRCDWCSRGLGRHCPTRKVLGIVKHPGAFREFLTLPETNLHIVPINVSNHAAVFVEPLAAACEILDQAVFPRQAEIAVLGDGKLGLLVAQVLQASGHEVHQFGHHKHKLSISENAGVTTEIVRSRLPVAAYDWVVEATGTADGLRQAVEMTRPRGTVFMKSTVHGKVAVDTAPVIVNEISLIGSRCGRFEPALNLLASGRIQVASMISEVMPLSTAPSAFGVAARSGVLKVLLEAR
ncbi:MAG TPA: alcohol dehydrogenase catalytic domain-containing protein [Terriglobia bacterium]|nr:alcohol dehydrogenase catalytic domain-containing protein [Terriglobia bacterium]